MRPEAISRKRIMPAVAAFLALLLLSLRPVTASDQSVSFFSWFPATEYKTITFIPSMEYDRAAQMCHKMRGMLLTFNWQELQTINHDLQEMYGPNEYWIGITKEYGVIRWADRSYYYPSGGFNISFLNDQNQEKTCGAVQVMRGFNNYLIQMTNCNLSKKAICEAWRTIGLFGILSITALVVSTLCLIILSFLLLRSFFTNKAAAGSTYVMKTSARGASAADN